MIFRSCVCCVIFIVLGGQFADYICVPNLGIVNSTQFDVTSYAQLRKIIRFYGTDKPLVNWCNIKFMGRNPLKIQKTKYCEVNFQLFLLLIGVTVYIIHYSSNRPWRLYRFCCICVTNVLQFKQYFGSYLRLDILHCIVIVCN